MFRTEIKLQEITNSGDFWPYLLTHGFLENESGRQLSQYIEERYVISSEWLSEFTSYERKNNNPYVKTIFIHEWQGDQLTLELHPHKAILHCAETKTEKEYRRCIHDLSPEEALLYVPTVRIHPSRLATFQKHIFQLLEATSFRKEDYRYISEQIAKSCLLSDNECNTLKVHRKEVVASILLAIYLVFHSLYFDTAAQGYMAIGEEGLWYAFYIGIFDLPVPIALTILAGTYAWDKYKRNKTATNKIQSRFFLTIGSIFFAVTFFYTSTVMRPIIGSFIDRNNLKKMEANIGDKGRPWTWDGLEQITLKKPSILRPTRGRYSDHSHYSLYAENIIFPFNLGDDADNAKRIEKQLENEITVYYYRHSRVIERICIGNKCIDDTVLRQEVDPYTQTTP